MLTIPFHCLFFCGILVKETRITRFLSLRTCVVRAAGTEGHILCDSTYENPEGGRRLLGWGGTGRGEGEEEGGKGGEGGGEEEEEGKEEGEEEGEEGRSCEGCRDASLRNISQPLWAMGGRTTLSMG